MEELIENGLNLSKLNQYMNKVYCGVAFNPHLLSFEEVKTIRETFVDKTLVCKLSIGEDWWLSSPGFYDCRVSYVSIGGGVYQAGDFVDAVNYVRPAFNIENSENLNLKLSDKVKVAGIPCTVVLIEDGKATALCDDYLFKSVFNEDENKGNDYETSDIKQNLENYFKDKELKVEVVKSQSLDEILEKSGLKSALDFSEEFSSDR